MIRRWIRLSSLIALIFLSISFKACASSFWSKTTDFLSGPTALKHSFFGNSPSSWSSMLTVDPSKIVSQMIKRGGLVVSPAMAKDLKIVGEYCHADSCQLNVLERRLLIHNFTIRQPHDRSQEDALRVERIALHWDSYLKPCVEIEVDDVFILVDFLNVLLTKNNWMVMSKKGFPPTFEEESSEDYNPEDSMLRVGSIKFSGNVHLRINSKPMKKSIYNMTFPFKKLKEFERIIQDESSKTAKATGRRGCTTTAIYELVDKQIKVVIQKAVKDVLADLALDGGEDTKDKLNAIKAGRSMFGTYSASDLR